jgi:PAS domain S-box-containing protein
MILASDLVLRERLPSSYRYAGATRSLAQEVLSTLEENPETDFKDKGKAEPVFAPFAWRVESGKQQGRVTVTTSRISGMVAQAALSAHSQPGRSVLDLYPEFLKNLPFGVVLLHLENPQDVKTYRIIDLNPAAAEITGSTPEALLGRTLADFPKLLEKPLAGERLRDFCPGEARDLGEISYGDERIRQGIYSVRVFPFSKNYVGVAFENVTARKHAQQAHLESEERLRLLIEGVREYAIFQLDPLGHIVSWNAGAERLKGYRTGEVLGKYFSVFYEPKDLESGRPEIKLAEAAQNGECEDEGWRVRKDGSRFWANVVITALRDPNWNLRGFVNLTRDMTERRAREQVLEEAKEKLELRVEQRAAVLAKVNLELREEIAERERIEGELRKSLEQLRALAARLQFVREEERTLVAREMHDELGQVCTAIKMDLALIGRKTTKRQAPLRAKVDSAIQLVNQMIFTLRRIASELRPTTLDDLGLTAALEWHAQEFEGRTGIRCVVALPQEQLALDSERSTAIFRIFQESLTNVVRHAEATRVDARLEREQDQLILQVHDNGRGFDAEQASTRKSLGLIGMQERAVVLNGKLKVEGVLGSGTTVTLRIPLPLSSLPQKES